MSITQQGVNKGNHDTDAATARLPAGASPSEPAAEQDRSAPQPSHAHLDGSPATDTASSSAMDRFLEQVKTQCGIVGALLVKADDMHFVPFDPEVTITGNGSAPAHAGRPYFTVQKRSIPFADGRGMMLITSIATVVGLS